MSRRSLRAYGHVIALDFRGHGRSQWADPPEYGLEVYLQDLVGFISQHLQTRVVLVGHSMGGHVAQLLARGSPRFARSVDRDRFATEWSARWRRASNGAGSGASRAARVRSSIRRRTWSSAFASRRPGHALTPAKIESLALQGSEQLPNGNWAFRFDPETRVPRTTMRGMRRPRLRRIGLPVLVLRGAKSALMTRNAARKMHRRLPRATLKEIDGAYHHVPLDQPDATVAAISEFLQTL